MSRVSMARILSLLLAAAMLAAAAPARAQRGDPVDVIVGRLSEALTAKDPSRFFPLFAASVPEGRTDRYRRDLFPANAVRAVVKERDRAPLEGVPPGDGFSLVVEFFVEMPGRARILTAGIDVRRPTGGDVDSWRIVGAEDLTSIEGLHRLRLDTSRPFAAKQLEITSEDVVIALADGTVFLVECDEGVTGLVLLGRGELRFSPSPPAERGQLRLFAGSGELVTPFESAFVRLSPADYEERVSTGGLTPAAPEPRLARRAREVFDRESPKSFSVDLQDLSRDAWHLLPQPDDFLADIDTRRYDTITFSRSSAQAEDVSLFRRRDQRTIVLYPSVAKLAARGRFYSDDAVRDVDVVDYNIDATIHPERRTVQARARLAMRIRATYLSTLTLRLAEPLTVDAVTSVEYGRLLHLRLRSQNTILINLPRSVSQDTDLTLVITYSGRLPSQDLDDDTVQVSRDDQQPGDLPPGTVEPHFLLSNRSFWYPQNPVPDYATATLRVAVPDGYRAVASGQPVGGAATALRDVLAAASGRTFTFRAAQPVRYLAVVISRLTPVAETFVSVVDDPAVGTGVDRVVIAAEATPRQRTRARGLAKTAEDILRFYASIIGDAPYASATLAVLESELPGGHGPAFMVIINDPIPNPNVTWRGDPAAFESFPDFFLAHEIAHQWWGQAVGWKNYHEQWLSEGFSQYFAALYAQKARGDRVFVDMLRQFRRWSLSESDQGPVHLGHRLGHIRSEPRVYRALVYNKGAAVLHMLRRLLGDQVFFAGLRRFYLERRYQKAGTDDLERAFEAESGLVLDRFFERWIYSTEIPRISHAATIGAGQVALRFEQTGEVLFDVPVTVTLVYADGRTEDTVVVVAQQSVERTIPASAQVRQVQVNRDSAALAEFVEVRAAN
jgi:hypothetical protein